MQKLFLKYPLVFMVKIAKWSLIFALMIAIRVVLLSHFVDFTSFLLDVSKTVCIFFPAISTLSFMDTLVVLMKEKNTSYMPFLAILVPLLFVNIALQPLLYSLTQNIPTSQLQKASNISISAFVEPASHLKTFVKNVYVVLDDARQAYFEGYASYLFFALSYVAFLFSFSIFTLKARWNLFNLFILFLFLFAFIKLYNIMNALEDQLYIFSFSTNQLKGIPTYIITIGISAFLYLYGLFFRLK